MHNVNPSPQQVKTRFHIEPLKVSVDRIIGDADPACLAEVVL